MYLCMHTYMHAYMHTFVHTCMHAYIHTYVHIFPCISIYIYISIYIHIGFHTSLQIHTHVWMSTDLVSNGGVGGGLACSAGPRGDSRAWDPLCEYTRVLLTLSPCFCRHTYISTFVDICIYMCICINGLRGPRAPHLRDGPEDPDGPHGPPVASTWEVPI